MSVEIRLPRILDPVVDDPSPIPVEAGTVGEALDRLLERHPQLRVHLFDEAGRLRPHVLCFVDGRSDRLEDRTRPVGDGATLEFLQAVSGGSGGPTPVTGRQRRAPVGTGDTIHGIRSEWSRPRTPADAVRPPR